MLPPRTLHAALPTGVEQAVTAALATRFGVQMATIRRLMRDGSLHEFGRARQVNSNEGDTFRAASSLSPAVVEDHRDATFVRVCYTQMLCCSC